VLFISSLPLFFLSPQGSVSKGTAYPDILKSGVCGIKALLSDPGMKQACTRITTPSLSLYELSGVFEGSGMSGACARFTSESMMTAYGQDSRLSKSLSAANHGKDVLHLNPQKEYQYCHLTTDKVGKLSVCGRCTMVSYCSQSCQKADWKLHKILCKTILQREKE